MRRILVALVFLASTSAAAVDYTDLWYNPSQPGYGFNLVESDDGSGAPFLFITFFIYGPSGAPTWYTAQLRWNGTNSFVGDLIATGGTFFGSPWNPANSSAAKVGSATFRPDPSNDYKASLSYNVTGVGSSSVSLTRQTLTRIETAGVYVGGQSGMYSSCNSPANNGGYLDNYELEVVNNSDGTVTYSFLYAGLSCQLSGKYVQNGQSLSVPNASYVCDDGTNAPAQMFEIKRTGIGLEGRFSATGGFDNCTENASFGGPQE